MCRLPDWSDRRQRCRYLREQAWNEIRALLRLQRLARHLAENGKIRRCSDQIDPSRIASGRELLKRVLDAIDELLTPRQRECLLRVAYGERQFEIARSLGVTKAAVSHCIRDGRAKLFEVERLVFGE